MMGRPGRRRPWWPSFAFSVTAPMGEGDRAVNRPALGVQRPPGGSTAPPVGASTPERPSAACTGRESAPRGVWPRAPRPTLGDATAVRAQAGLDPSRQAAPGVTLDPAAGPICPSCGRQHPRPAARDPLAHLVRPEAPADPRTYGAAPAGWGRRRGGR
jgi:hypothetical protein